MIAAMRRFRDLSPERGLTPEVGRWFAALEEVRLGTFLFLHDLAPEQLSWTPGPEMNSIGTLLNHIAESEAFWILERIGGRPLPAERRELYRMDVFGVPHVPQAPRASTAFFIGILSDLRTETQEVLAGITDQDLDGKRVWNDPHRPEDQEVFTVRWILNHVLLHEAHHRGEIAMTRRMLGAGPPPILSDGRQDEV
jgi:uncharacterized damage-inducible protein DinB